MISFFLLNSIIVFFEINTLQPLLLLGKSAVSFSSQLGSDHSKSQNIPFLGGSVKRFILFMFNRHSDSFEMPA